MKEIKFYKTNHAESPVEEFLDSLSGKQAQKVTWVLQLFEEMPVLPGQYFKKIVNSDEIWEIRVQFGNNIFRLLGFFVSDDLFVVTNGFQKKTQKTPISEIQLAEQRKREYLKRGGR